MIKEGSEHARQCVRIVHKLHKLPIFLSEGCFVGLTAPHPQCQEVNSFLFAEFNGIVNTASPV